MTILTIFGNSERKFTLCDTCLYSHIVMNGAETRFTGCFVGGELREIKFAVTECSTYFDRSRRRISNSIRGFVRNNESQDIATEAGERELAGNS